MFKRIKQRYRWWRTPKAEKERIRVFGELLSTICKSRPGTPDGFDVIASGEGGSWEQNAGQVICSKQAIQNYVDKVNEAKK